MKNQEVVDKLNAANAALTDTQRQVVGLLTYFSKLPPEMEVGTAMVMPTDAPIHHPAIDPTTTMDVPASPASRNVEAALHRAGENPLLIPQLQAIDLTAVDAIHASVAMTETVSPSVDRENLLPTLESLTQPLTEQPEAVKKAAEARMHAQLIEQRKHFVGTGSLFARHLSPSVMSNAKGFMAPDFNGLKQYKEDVSRLSPEVMAKWPAGFYRNKTSQMQQFMFKTATMIIVLDNLPSHDRKPFFIINLNKDMTPQRLELDDMTLTQLMQARDEFMAAYHRLDPEAKTTV